MVLTALREKKNIHRQNQIKPYGSWRYIEVYEHVIYRPVQETEQYLYIFFFTSDPPHSPTTIDWHYMTEETKSPVGKQTNIKFSFLGELSL